MGQNQKHRKDNDMYEHTKEVVKVFGCQTTPETIPNMFAIATHTFVQGSKCPHKQIESE